MSLDFNFSLEELEAAEAATANPYLSDPARGLQLLARLIGHPAPEAVQEAQRAQLARLHSLIHQDFIALTARGSYPGEAQALRQLLALEDALENLALFPDLASKSVVGVGGGFSAGKSRFLNTLLGVDLLPESLEPTTAIPSFITRGAADIVALNSFNHRIALDREALQAITHAFNDHYRDSLGEGFGFAHILKLLMLHQPRLPWENLAFLDTPGYSKADAEGTAETDQGIALKQLSEADHVLWLLSAKNGSIRQDDLDFLRRLNHPQPIFFVVTQADLVGEARIGAILDSTRTAIEQAGIPCAGLLAWAAPLGSEHGERIAGDDVRALLDQLDSQPKYTQHRRTCEQVLDGYIRHNQDSLAGSRKKLALLNTLLPLADQLPESERSTLQELIREQRSTQKTFSEQITGFKALKYETLEILGVLLSDLSIADHQEDESETAETYYQDGMRYHSGDSVEKDETMAAELFRKAADLGHLQAQSNLGICYLLGKGVDKDEELGAKILEEAANKGNSYAQLYIGNCYHHGRGVKEDKEISLLWHKKSATEGNSEAQFILAGEHLKNKEYHLAAEWLIKAAEQELPQAQCELGKFHHFGLGVKKDNSAAVTLFRKAAEQNHAEAQYYLAECYYHGHGLPENEEAAAIWYRKAAEQGYADAQFNLAQLYHLGNGLTKNEETAALWYRKAAEQGNNRAQFNLGSLYKLGIGVKESETEALFWYQKSSEQGNPNAQFRLAMAYLFGEGVPKNESVAVDLFRKSAEQGDPDSQYSLGHCYYLGQGVGENKAQAVKWYRKAAEQGDAGAQYSLGVSYELGDGVPRNPQESLTWYRKAAAQGHKKAKEKIS